MLVQRYRMVVMYHMILSYKCYQSICIIIRKVYYSPKEGLWWDFYIFVHIVVFIWLCLRLDGIISIYFVLFAISLFSMLFLFIYLLFIYLFIRLIYFLFLLVHFFILVAVLVIIPSEFVGITSISMRISIILLLWHHLHINTIYCTVNSIYFVLSYCKY